MYVVGETTHSLRSCVSIYIPSRARDTEMLGHVTTVVMYLCLVLDLLYVLLSSPLMYPVWVLFMY